jgi:hypothetical protein
LGKLNNYFDRLKESGTPLPRRCLIPHKHMIASATGIDRDIFYNPEAVAMLDKVGYQL